MPQTVLELDLIGFSTICAALEESLGANAALELQRQIQGLIAQALQATGTDPGVVLQHTGDGALLLFPEPNAAVVFAEALHRASRDANEGKANAIALRVFRVGVATGEIAQAVTAEGRKEYGGMTLARAVRLEAAADPGGLLVDATSFAALAASRREGFGPEEIVTGKRDERFPARRRRYYDPLPAALSELQAVRKAAADPQDAAIRAEPVGREARRAILEKFDRLADYQYDTLIFLLDVPLNRRPHRLLPLIERRNALLHWAEQDRKLPDLHAELTALVGPPPNPR